MHELQHFVSDSSWVFSKASKSAYTIAKVSVVYPLFDIFDFFENLFLEKKIFFLEIFFPKFPKKEVYIFFSQLHTFF